MVRNIGWVCLVSCCFLVGCGDDGATETSSNGAVATSNGTSTGNGATSTSNGSSSTSNGTSTSNSTTSTSNSTTSTSNSTTSTSNGTSSTSNGTTNTSNGTNLFVFDHSDWSITAELSVRSGCFDYIGLRQDLLSILEGYTDALAAVDLTANMTAADRTALWINAYNALTVAGVLEETAERPSFRVDDDDFAFFKERRFIVGGVELSLDLMEHGILRNDTAHASVMALDDASREVVMREAERVGAFDPRIHFALNCASTSCPDLRYEAFVGERLDLQLLEQSNLFLNNATKGAGPDGISSLFLWFQQDFEQIGGVDQTIEMYRTGGVDDVVLETFLPYDWSLNACP